MDGIISQQNCTALSRLKADCKQVVATLNLLKNDNSITSLE